MNKMAGFVAFVMGMTVGAALTWKYAKKKYERIAQEEIDSVKASFSKKREKDTNKNCDDEEKPSHISTYEQVLKTMRYVEREEKEETSMDDKPYVISPEEFGEFDEYEQISLTYYSDGVLADENDEIIDDAEDVVGTESLNHFGEYEDDSVFVRNDRLKCDYEILLDIGNYSDVLKMKPHQKEV